MVLPGNEGICDQIINFLKENIYIYIYIYILLWAFIFHLNVVKIDEMKIENVKFMPDSSVRCVSDHICNSNI